MSSYKDLTDNVNDSFDFVLRGKKFTMRYPKTEELEDIQAISEELDSLDTKTSEGRSRAKTLNEQLGNAMYEYITPVEHETPIKDALKNENIKVLKNFNVMIKTELAV